MESNENLIKRLKELPEDELHYIMGRLSHPYDISEDLNLDYYRGYLEQEIEYAEFAELPAFWPTANQISDEDGFVELDQKFKDKVEATEGIHLERGHVIAYITYDSDETTIRPAETYDWCKDLLLEDPLNIPWYIPISRLWYISKAMAIEAFEHLGSDEYRIEGFFVVPDRN